MTRIIKAFFYSLQGFKLCFKSEAAFRQEIYLSVILIPVLIFLPLEIIYKLYMLTAWILVLLTELINTAIETTINRISTEHHPLSGKAKDIGSATVFLALLHAIAVWGLSLWHGL